MERLLVITAVLVAAFLLMMYALWWEDNERD
jgi:hypothetical protein